MAVRDTAGEVDAEAKDITYAYDANGNMVGISDDSSGAQVDDPVRTAVRLDAACVVVNILQLPDQPEVHEA